VSGISGPLLDRIDIHIDEPAVKFKELASDTPRAQPRSAIPQRSIGTSESGAPEHCVEGA